MTNALDIKIKDVENKISDANGLVTTFALNDKAKEIDEKTINHDRYITTFELNKFSGAIFDGRLKQEHLVIKANPDIISQGDNKNEKKKKNVTNVWFR